MTTYYDILEVDEEATTAELKKAYRRMAKKFHPDINPDDHAIEKFREIEVAYSCLSKSDSRMAYDRLLLFKRTNYSNPTVEFKFHNDLHKRRKYGEAKAERRTQMSYQQYRREELLTESLWALVLNTAITLLVGALLLRLLYLTAESWYGPDSDQWGQHIGMQVMAFTFFLSILGISYIYEPMIKRLFVGKPKRSTSLVLSNQT